MSQKTDGVMRLSGCKGFVVVKDNTVSVASDEWDCAALKLNQNARDV